MTRPRPSGRADTRRAETVPPGRRRRCTLLQTESCSRTCSRGSWSAMAAHARPRSPGSAAAYCWQGCSANGTVCLLACVQAVERLAVQGFPGGGCVGTFVSRGGLLCWGGGREQRGRRIVLARQCCSRGMHRHARAVFGACACQSGYGRCSVGPGLWVLARQRV